MFLKLYHEMVGYLKEVRTKNQIIELVFTFDHTIEIPENALTTDVLKDLVREKIGIFNCGVEGYRIRKIK